MGEDNVPMAPSHAKMAEVGELESALAAVNERIRQWHAANRLSLRTPSLRMTQEQRAKAEAARKTMEGEATSLKARLRVATLEAQQAAQAETRAAVAAERQAAQAEQDRVAAEQRERDADWVFERARNVLGYNEWFREDTAGDYERVQAAADAVRGGTLSVPQALAEVDDILRERAVAEKAAEDERKAAADATKDAEVARRQAEADERSKKHLGIAQDTAKRVASNEAANRRQRMLDDVSKHAMEEFQARGMTWKPDQGPGMGYTHEQLRVAADAAYQRWLFEWQKDSTPAEQAEVRAEMFRRYKTTDPAAGAAPVAPQAAAQQPMTREQEAAAIRALPQGSPERAAALQAYVSKYGSPQ